MSLDLLKQAHRHSIFNRDEIERSEACGCFHCLETFAPSAIEHWTDQGNEKGETPLCPHCGIDSVLGSASGVPLTGPFLSAMHDRWFTADDPN